MRLTLCLIFLLLPIAGSAQQPSFLPADQCMLCHRLVPGVQAEGTKLSEPIAHHPTWRSSMMANASRDPYWLAKVQAEKSQHPGAPVSLDAVCMRCHAPAQAKTAELAAQPLNVSHIDALGKDGVACLVCHQIVPDGLGAKATFTGQPAYAKEPTAFGPHANPFEMPMLHHTGVTPTESAHILESRLCGSCHTVITPTLDAQGKVLGEFLEQGPYLEWLASGMPEERSCQSCHTPKARTEENEDGRFYIAHNPMGRSFPPTAARSPFGVHSFAGGNVSMLEHLATLGSEMKAPSSEAKGLAASAERTRQNLRRAASLRIESSPGAEDFSLSVTIRNHTGHKLPTGFPSRRVWLHLTVEDAAGAVLYESGAFNPATGDIQTADPAVNTGLQPHLAVIRTPNQVALYETELADPAGKHTHSLLSAARYYKDNRLLPRGFDLSRTLPEGIPSAWLAPVGAQADPDFAPGSDTVTYALPAALRARAKTVKAELLYQSLKPSQLRALKGKAGKETDALVDSLAKATGASVIASTSLTLGTSNAAE